LPPAFDRVVYINLQRSVVRRKCATEMLTRANLSAGFERWNATDGNTFSKADLEGALTNLTGGSKEERLDEHWERGTLGCRTSHLSVLQDLLDKGKPGERYLVLEDDAVLPKNMEPHAHQLLATAPDGWDVLKLNCFAMDDTSYLDKTVVQNLTSLWTLATSSRTIDAVFRTKMPGTSSDIKKDYKDCWHRKMHEKGKECQICGGNHAVVYKWDSLDKLLKHVGSDFNVDCAVAQPFSRGINVFCVQGVFGVGVMDPQGSDRIGNVDDEEDAECPKGRLDGWP
jgi:GR25 family glycosyltransferase involved in LPS biosynthesis